MGLRRDEFTGQSVGEYKILSRLAVGGSAEIFLGYAESGPAAFSPVVVKRLMGDAAQIPLEKDALLNEARLISRLKHANVAQLVKFTNTSSETIMAMEFVDGPTVEELLELAPSQEIPVGMAVAIAHAAARGLGHAHLHKSDTGNPLPIIHRDFNPKNVMCAFSGAIKVLDFGIAKLKGAQQHTRAGMVKGTTSYMSPEQTTGRPLDVRSDVFSLGIVFHELLTGQRLFFRSSPTAEMQAILEDPIPVPSSVSDRIPKQLDRLVMRALERERENRFANAEEFAKEIEKAVPAMVWPAKEVSSYLASAFALKRAEVIEALEKIHDLSSQQKTFFGVPALREKPVSDLGSLEENNQFDLAPMSTKVMARPAELSMAPRAARPSARISKRLTTTDVDEQVFDDALNVEEPKSAMRRYVVLGAAALGVGALIGAGIFFLMKTDSVAATSRLEIKSAMESQVLLGDQMLGSTPLEIMLRPGKHELKFISEAGIKYMNVELFENNAKKIEVTW
jgi:serine/threonine protein kinase